MLPKTRALRPYAYLALCASVAQTAAVLLPLPALAAPALAAPVPALAVPVPAPPAVAPEGAALRRAAQEAFPNGVAAGDVSQDSAILWARLAAPGRVTFEWSRDQGFVTVVGNQSVEVLDPEVPAKADIGGLSAGTRYHYRAIAANGAYVTGRFRTPAAPGLNQGLRFGISGDWNGNLAPYISVRNIPERDLDFFVAYGDTVIADSPSPDFNAMATRLPEFRIKHRETLSERLGLNFWPEVRASTPFFATIDDHEVVDDFAGGASPATDPRFMEFPGAFISETPYYRGGLQAFQEYMPIREEVWPHDSEPRFAGKPRLYRYRTFGNDAALFMVDARSFRDAPLAKILSRDYWAAGSFLFESAWPGRTMLGRPQITRLKDDLLAAEKAGITWKFVLIPEPIQSLGVLAAYDRYEGYAAERTELLSFIHDRGLKNVVFVTADFHGTMVNNLVYSWLPLLPTTRMNSWEIVTGPVAIKSLMGPTIAKFAAKGGLVSAEEKAAYDQMPSLGKDRFLRKIINKQIKAQFLDPLGLEDSGIPATLETGDYIAAHTFGWTEFEIQGTDLVVTTYGIAPYTPDDLLADPKSVLERQPDVSLRFRVRAAL